MFLEYRGLRESIEFVAVPAPVYTNQSCHQCLHIGLRSEKSSNAATVGCPVMRTLTEQR
jgi:putative transposase